MAAQVHDNPQEFWKPVLKWKNEFIQGIAHAYLDEGVEVPLDRMASHCGIETGYTGDPKLKSQGVNRCCPNPGTDCTPDCRAWGLFQIFWPTFSGVDFSRLFDPDYNSYVAARMLAINFKACGSWTKASNKFFSGACDLNNTTDNSTGTNDKQYQDQMIQNMVELNQIGVGNSSTNPKEKNPPKGGNGSTTTVDNTCFTIPIIGTVVCPNQLAGVNPLDALNPTLIINKFLPRVIVLIVGLVLLAVAVLVITRG